MSDYQQQEERETWDAIASQETEDEDRTKWESAEINLLVLGEDLTPSGVEVDTLAREALDVAFEAVHQRIKDETGDRYSGDLMPGEYESLLRVVRLMVRSVLVNGPIQTS